MQEKVIVIDDHCGRKIAHKEGCRWSHNATLTNLRPFIVDEAKTEGYEPCDECQTW